MRKSLFAIGLLAITYSVQAQNVLHVDDAATTFVSKGTLVYNGGGLQMKGSGVIENHGNVMVSGSATDSFKTIDASNVDKTEANGGGNFINKLNEPGAYATYNTNDPLVAPAYTYGQLFISNIPQGNLTGIVDQEFKAIKHGTYQQIGIPFYDKTASTLTSELGKTFSNTRYSQNEILWANNTNIVSTNFNTASKFGVTNPGYSYYMLGGLGLDLGTATPKVLKGRPQTDIGTSIALQGAAASVNFGTNGNATNQYNEKYNTYVQDEFENVAWGTPSYGRYMYQFGNPFFTNLDLSQIARNEAGGDGINLTNIQGVRLEVSPNAVQTTSGGTTAVGSAAYKYITFAAGVPSGDVDYMMVRPMGTFVVKLTDNNAADQFNFANLRRFNYYTRDQGTAYNVAANKSVGTGSVKQLGVIGLDINGNEVARTYYVVYPSGTTGHSATQTKTQVTADINDSLGTYEEAFAGGYDTNFTNQYWLYINEANENNFNGKNIKMMNYNLNKIKSYKFEIRENAALVSNGTHALSTGIGFYYKAPNGTVQQAVQGAVVPVSGAEYDLYYGEPKNIVLATNENKGPSRTQVVYNPGIDNYIVRFDPNWKKADIEVYDMSGKLVISKKAVTASTDFVIELDSKIKNSYVVKVVSEKGEVVNTKILR